MTRWIKNGAIGIRKWMDLDAIYSVAEFKTQLCDWTRDRRIVVAQELVGRSRCAAEKALIIVYNSGCPITGITIKGGIP
jgi:hypothetical protein